DEAEAHRARVANNFQEAMWTIEDLMYVFDNECTPRPVLSELRDYQAERILSFLAPFCEDQSEKPLHRRQKQAALTDRGRLYQSLGDTEKAQHAFQQAIGACEQYTIEVPGERRIGLVCALFILGEEVYRCGRIDEANAHFVRAMEVAMDMLRENPSDR